MAGPFIGQLGAFGLAKEVTLGTFVAPTRFIPVRLPLNVGSPDIALLESVGVRNIPDVAYKTAQGAGHLKSGKGKFEIEPENIGEVLMGAFGTDNVTGTPAFTHTFTRAAVAQLPSYSLWVKNGLSFPQFAGCMLNKLDVHVKAPDWVMGDFDYVGSKFVSGGTTKSTSYSTLNPFTFAQATVTVGGSAYTNYEEIKISIDNMVKVLPVVGGSIYSNVVYSEGLRVSVAATVVVQDAVELNAFLNGTTSSVTLVLTSAQNIPTTSTPYSLTFTIGSIAYKAAPINLTNGLIKIAFQADAFYNTGNTATISAALVNSISAAY